MSEIVNLSVWAESEVKMGTINARAKRAYALVAVVIVTFIISIYMWPFGQPIQKPHAVAHNEHELEKESPTNQIPSPTAGPVNKQNKADGRQDLGNDVPPLTPTLTTKSSSEEFQDIKTRYESAKKLGASKDLQHLINDVESFLSKWPQSSDAPEALKLISRCYTELGEADLAFKAFVKYADFVGGQKRVEGQLSIDAATIGVLQAEADERYRQNDFVAALRYYDLILSRYPKNLASAHASAKCAEHHFKQGELKEAILGYNKIIKEFPDSTEARSAYTPLAVIKANLGDHQGSIGVWKEYLTKWPEDEAYAHFNMGMLYYGVQNKVQASQEFQTVLKAKNNDSYLASSKKMLSQIWKEIEDAK